VVNMSLRFFSSSSSSRAISFFIEGNQKSFSRVASSAMETISSPVQRAAEEGVERGERSTSVHQEFRVGREGGGSNERSRHTNADGG
jgi:hypothetical protein